MAGRQKDELLGLLEQARELAKVESTAQQVILVKTAKGNVYHVSNRDVERGADEDGLLRQLRDGEDTQVQAVACMWKEGGRWMSHPSASGSCCWSWIPGTGMPFSPSRGKMCWWPEPCGRPCRGSEPKKVRISTKPPAANRGWGRF